MCMHVQAHTNMVIWINTAGLNLFHACNSYIQVQVGFELTTNLLKYLNNGTDKESSDNVEIEVRDKERRIHFKQDLIIEFNNRSRQVS